jgi:hypothetical protein
VTNDEFRPNNFRQRADAVRSIPLEVVLTRWGSKRDQRDRSRWRTPHGPLSITGSKFFNWQLEIGGGGAIDLVMHLSGGDARAAVSWLEQLGWGAAAASSTTQSSPVTCWQPSSSCRDAPAQRRGQLRLPAANLAKLQRVHRYLTLQRGLAVDLLQPLIDAGKVYADQRGNAVFLMVTGKANRPVGAELRGTSQRAWRGLVPGSCRDAGYFWIGQLDPEQIVICESAIDAISCFQLHSRHLHARCICISSAGVRPDPPWLRPLLARGYPIYCGFDDDKPGNEASHQMIRRHPSIKRLPPPAHDWNDTLIASL